MLYCAPLQGRLGLGQLAGLHGGLGHQQGGMPSLQGAGVVGLHGIEHSPGHDSDLEAIDDGFISVTPLQLDLTHDASLAALRGAYS